MTLTAATNHISLVSVKRRGLLMVVWCLVPTPSAVCQTWSGQLVLIEHRGNLNEMVPRGNTDARNGY